jgi:hypothetical protein
MLRGTQYHVDHQDDWQLIEKEGFNWGPPNLLGRRIVYWEIWQDKCYEKIFEVEENDIVVDLGAGIGDFAWSIKHKNPSAIYCFEPALESLPTLEDNKSRISNCHIIKKFMSDVNDENNITWDYFLKSNNLEKIDFVKTDCEGGEYEIFNIKNIFWVKQNIKKITGEWHLETPERKAKFREFRDIYLKLFPNFKVYSVNDVDITHSIWTEEFINYYNQVIISIDNR